MFPTGSKHLIVLGVALMGLPVAARPALPANPPPLRFTVPAGEHSMDREQTLKSLSILTGHLYQKTGVRLVLDPVAAYSVARQKGLPGNLVRINEIKRRLKARLTDIVPLTAEEYFLHNDLRQSAIPFMTWTVKGQPLGQECLYVSAKKGYTHPRQLKGKIVSGVSSYITIRQILAGAGVNAPLWKFFGSFTFEDDPKTQYQSLVDGKVDVLHDTWQGYTYTRALKGAFRDIHPLACLKQQPLVMLSLRKGVSMPVAKKIGDYLLSAHRDPGLGPAKWFFVAFQGQFVYLPPDYLKNYAAAFETARKNGWVKEARQWQQQFAPVFFRQWLRGISAHRQSRQTGHFTVHLPSPFTSKKMGLVMAVASPK